MHYTQSLSLEMNALSHSACKIAGKDRVIFPSVIMGIIVLGILPMNIVLQNLLVNSESSLSDAHHLATFRNWACLLLWNEYTRFLYGCLSLLLLYWIAPVRQILQNIFAPVGKMAFSNFLLQVITGMLIFHVFGLYGKLQRYELMEVGAHIWVFQIIFSKIWLMRHRLGPFEWLWHHLISL